CTNSNSSKDCSLSIDYYIILYYRVTFNTFYWVALLIQWKALCSKGNPLVYLNIVAYNRGRSNYYSSSVIDSKTVTNPCSRMDINTSFRMCHLSDNPGQQGNFQLIQRMCYSVIGNSPDRWIAEDHFFPALCSRIAKEGCFYICCKYLTNLRKLLDKLHTEFCSPGLCLV